MANVLITGASGLIGKPLSELLSAAGHTVVHVGRRENLSGKYKCYQWNLDDDYIDPRAFENIDTIIHLAGAGIADKRWTNTRKTEIIKSRVSSGKLLMEYMNANPGKIKTFIGASAIGYYGTITNSTIYTEDMPSHNDFLGSVCKQWEETYNSINETQTRKVIIRIGVVLSNNGGALLKLAKTAKTGLGAALGTGKQHMPWIHIDDLISVFMLAVETHKFNGIYNATSPQHLTNKEVTVEIAHAYGKRVIMPNVPKFILKLLLGEMADMVCEGSRVSCEKLLNSGFTFKYPTLSSALKNLIR